MNFYKQVATLNHYYCTYTYIQIYVTNIINAKQMCKKSEIYKMI